MIDPIKIDNPFSGWVKDVMPSAYDNSLSYYELLTKLLNTLESVLNASNNANDGLTELQTLYNELKTYVDDYFTDLNVATEINAKLDALVLDGTMATIINTTLFNQLNSDISDVDDKADATSLVIGELEDLETDDKTDIVSAINEVKSNTLSSLAPSLKNKNVIVIGDSLTITGRWGTNFINISGCVGENYGNGSAGFVYPGNTSPYSNMNFIQMLNSIILSKSTEERNVVDYIIVGGGINDALTPTVELADLKTNVQSFIDNAKTNFPNAKLIIFPLHTFKNLDKESLQKYQGIIEVCANNGVMTTNKFIWWTIADQTYDDGGHVHLTAGGYTLLGGLVASYIAGNNSINERDINYVLDASVTGTLNVTLKDNVVYAQGVLTFTGTPVFANRLFTVDALITPPATRVVQIPSLIYDSTNVNTIACISVNDGNVALGKPSTVYTAYDGFTVYVNGSWQIGLTGE